MGYSFCCSTFLTLLPDPSLPFLPALFLGTISASLILLYLYKKETNLPLNDILLHMFRSLFFHFPSSGCSDGYSETDQCNRLQCVRCHKYSELQQQIGERWRRWKKREVFESLGRVEQAVRRLDGEGEMEEDKNIAHSAINEGEEERTGKDDIHTEGELKYRGKLRRHEDKTSFLDKNNGKVKDWKEDSYAEIENERDEELIKDERESVSRHQWNARNALDKGASVEKEKIHEREGKQNWERKKNKKQKTQMHYQKPTIFHMNLPANPTWNEYVHVNEQQFLKLNFELIAQEYEKVFRKLQSGDSTGWKNNLIPHGHWCIFPFVDQGTVVPSNCQCCPGVAEIILGCLPAMMNDCVFGNAAFSILYPDSHIAPHHGPTNLRLRCHLGLKVPTGCWLEVAGQQYRWAVGETLLFDDSFTHSAHFMNQPNSVHSEPRAVLLLDFWHPDVSAKEKECLLKLLAPEAGL